MLFTWTRRHRPVIPPSGTGFVNQSLVQAAPLAISFVGRLDNQINLCKALKLSIHSTLTDEQLTLKAYAEWGDRCCQYLLGTYSFAIWDARSATLFCARDHMGCTPFYYSLTPERFVFSTCIEEVLAADSVSNDLDDRFVRSRLANKSYIDNERTFYQAVRKLPAGHTLTVTPDRAEVKRYWFPENAPERHFADDDECVSTFVDLLQTVIQEQLPSQANVGVHLTGGLDSSTTTAIASRILRSRGDSSPFAYCWLPPPVSEVLPPEHDLIEQVRAQENIALRFQHLSTSHIMDGLSRDLARLPAAEMLFQEHPVMQQAQQDDVQVLLSGWGGDELISFNGRGYYASLLRSRQWRRLWQESQTASDRPFQHMLNQGVMCQYPWLNRTRKQIKKCWQHQPRTHYLHPDFMRQVKPYPRKPLRHISTRQTQLDLLNNGHLTERMEAWAALGTEHNIMYRYPLLDKRIVEFALGLSPEMFRRGKWNRWLMRNTAAQLLPADVAWNPDKSDPIRMAPLKTSLHEAFIQIRQQLQAQSANTARAKYFDMPRLLADMSADSFAKRTSKVGRISHALLFLDF